MATEPFQIILKNTPEQSNTSNTSNLVYDPSAGKISTTTGGGTQTVTTNNTQNNTNLTENPPFIKSDTPSSFNPVYDDKYANQQLWGAGFSNDPFGINLPGKETDYINDEIKIAGNVENPLLPKDEKLTSNSGRGNSEIRNVTQEGKAAATRTPSGGSPIMGDSFNVAVSISSLAKQAGLSKNDLLAMSTYLTGTGNNNLLAAWVYMLYNGSACVGSTVRSLDNDNINESPITISGNMLSYMWTKGNSIIKGNFHKGIQKAFMKTPAYKDKFFEDVGDIGVTLVSNSERVPSSPINGPNKHVPSLLEKALNSIHPKLSSELEKYINVLKGKTYLALPANVLGSIQYAINYINGVASYIAGIIYDIYKGALKAIQEFVAVIDGIMGMVMGYLLFMIDQIIPLEILCFILDIISIFAGDLTTYTNFFTSSLKISDVLKAFDVDAGIIGDFLSDPTGSIKSFLPKEFQEIMHVVDSVANDPMGYLGSVLSDHGYGYMANYLKGDIMGGILNQFGSKAPVLYPLAGVLKKYGINGQINLTDPTQPSPNVVMPPALVAMRKGIRKTFTSLKQDIRGLKDTINEGLYTVATGASLSIGGNRPEDGPTNSMGL